MTSKITLLKFSQIFKGIKFKFIDDFHIEYEIITDFALFGNSSSGMQIYVTEKYWSHKKERHVIKYAEVDCEVHLETIKFLSDPGKYPQLFWELNCEY